MFWESWKRGKLLNLNEGVLLWVEAGYFPGPKLLDMSWSAFTKCLTVIFSEKSYTFLLGECVLRKSAASSRFLNCFGLSFFLGLLDVLKVFKKLELYLEELGVELRLV